MSTIFNANNYITSQSNKLHTHFDQWISSLYIQWKLLDDSLLERLLPWYKSGSQSIILQQALNAYPNTRIIYLIDAKDLVRDKQFKEQYLSFEQYITNELEHIKSNLNTSPEIAFVLLDDDFIPPHVQEFWKKLETTGYNYHINTIPDQTTDHTIFASYDQNYASKFSWEKNHLNWHTLPCQQLEESHPINMVAYALWYTTLEESSLVPHISDPDASIIYNNCLKELKTILTTHITLFENWYGDEDDIRLIENLIQQVQET